MARICSVIALSHSPFLYAPSQEWEAARLARFSRGALSPDTPIDSADANAEKHRRIMEAVSVLKEKLHASKPDVLLVFGDDQLEQFSFANFPAFSLFTGDQYEGFKISRWVGLPVGSARRERTRSSEEWVKVKSSPAFARTLLRELILAGFDVAMNDGLSNHEEGIGHAFTRPSFYLDPEYTLPTVPFFVNCYYGPQPTAMRCYQLGKAVRTAIERMPMELNVAIIGSGGLWHMPNYPQSWFDETFDPVILECVQSGDAHRMAEFFDTVSVPYDITNKAEVELASGGTGMVLGIGGGTGETRNWVVAGAIMDGVPGCVVDYVKIYASPVGAAFAYWVPS